MSLSPEKTKKFTALKNYVISQAGLSASSIGLWAFMCTIKVPVSIGVLARHFKKPYAKIDRYLKELIKRNAVVVIENNGEKKYQANSNTYYSIN